MNPFVLSLPKRFDRPKANGFLESVITRAGSINYNDPVWSDWSSAQLAKHWGQLRINPIIYTELCYQATSPDDVNDTMEQMGLVYADLPRACLFAAGQAYRSYRQRCGVKTAPLPDFFIGAHAQEAGLILSSHAVHHSPNQLSLATAARLGFTGKFTGTAQSSPESY